MKVSLEISYYPLNQEFIPHILDFIERMKKHEDLIVKSNGLSTHVFGEYDASMQALVSEMKKSCELPHSVFLIKLVNSDRQ